MSSKLHVTIMIHMYMIKQDIVVSRSDKKILVDE